MSLKAVKAMQELNYKVWSFFKQPSRQSQRSVCWPFLSFERLKILLHLYSNRGRFRCAPTCQREIWLHCMARGCFCVWQSWFGSAFIDTWDQRAAWPETLLLLPCGYIITGGILLELVLGRLARGYGGKGVWSVCKDAQPNLWHTKHNLKLSRKILYLIRYIMIYNYFHYKLQIIFLNNQ